MLENELKAFKRPRQHRSLSVIVHLFIAFVVGSTSRWTNVLWEFFLLLPLGVKHGLWVRHPVNIARKQWLCMPLLRVPFHLKGPRPHTDCQSEHMWNVFCSQRYPCVSGYFDAIDCQRIFPAAAPRSDGLADPTRAGGHALMGRVSDNSTRLSARRQSVSAVRLLR
ncbi:hypothetical protein F4860DRAFT_495780 [Xylaria cubensis]|nr:hypothetical protein F4860DRAFT_495780 [Xylaria cubensis]